MQTVADKLEAVKTRIAALGYTVTQGGPPGLEWAYVIMPSRHVVWTNPDLSPTKALQNLRRALKDLPGVIADEPQRTAAFREWMAHHCPHLAQEGAPSQG